MTFAALTNGAWLAASGPSWVRFHRALADPEATQRALLNQLVRRNTDSAFGRAYCFAEIHDYETFARQAPITEYDTLEPWINRIREGEQGVLTREPVTRLMPTSGSTAARKLIPYTASFQSELNAAIGPWMVELCREHPSVALGPAYWSVSPAIGEPDVESLVPIGFEDDSAYLGGVRQRLVAAGLAAPPEVRFAKDVADGRYLTLLCLLRQPELRLMSVWHPSFLTLLLDALRENWTELLEDVQRGGCRRASRLPVAVQRAVSARPQRRRADELRGLGAADPHTLWPHWRIVSCWGDAQATLPARELQRRLPRVVIQAKGLLATEAVVSIPFRDAHPIAIRSHFFEFIDSSGALRLAHELRCGEAYEIIVTTGGGLWRYRLGDRVEVDAMIARTPSLRFLGRSGGVSDLCGEKLAEAFVTRAIDRACARSGKSPGFALLAPEQSDHHRWHYTLFVDGDAGAALALDLEAELRANPHYALCRDLGQLGPLELVAVGPDAPAIHAEVATAEGRRWGDVKPQSLSTRQDWRRLFERSKNPQSSRNPVGRMATGKVAR